MGLLRPLALRGGDADDAAASEDPGLEDGVAGEEAWADDEHADADADEDDAI